MIFLVVKQLDNFYKNTWHPPNRAHCGKKKMWDVTLSITDEFVFCVIFFTLQFPEFSVVSFAAAMRAQVKRFAKPIN